MTTEPGPPTQVSIESAGTDAHLPSDAVDEIAQGIAEVTAKVPEIGDAWRWYDIPYRFCQWLVAGPPRRLLGWRARQFLSRWTNFFIPFNEIQRQRAERLDHWMHNLIVPSDEHVHQGGIWVVELFPPSRSAQLLHALRRNGWDQDDTMRHHDGSNAQQLERARAGRGWRWWRLGEISDPDAGFIAMRHRRERLPQEFSLIDVRAMQVGTSLTMVSAFFRLSDYGRNRLDQVWHATHEPTLEMRGLRRPHVEGRHFAAIRAGQAERQRLHDTARDWLADRCPGAFADTPGRHPVVDLTLFEKFDPATEPPGRPLREPIRALGLDHLDLSLFQSPQLSGLVFCPSDEHAQGYNVLNNCWGVVGNAKRFSDLNERSGYGDRPYSPQTIAHMVDDEVRAFSQYLAVMRYLDNLTSTYARARDLAPTRHGRYRARRLQQLRRELLTTGLDLSTVGRDTADLWSQRWRSYAGVEVVGTEPHGLPEGVQRHDDYDFIDHLGKIRKRTLRSLRADDAAYREALVTVASLGSSVEASRMGRRALWVSAASLGVAILTLLLANTGGHTLWSDLFRWLRD